MVGGKDIFLLGSKAAGACRRYTIKQGFPSLVTYYNYPKNFQKYLCLGSNLSLSLNWPRVGMSKWGFAKLLRGHYCETKLENHYVWMAEE